MSKRRLPPLNPLRNFEAAARAAFVRAAEELNVTPVAVSRQVGVLEDYFGKPLFVRHANTIALTDHGRALLPSVTTALDTLADGARRLRAATDTPVVVCTYQAFAMHWLIPRMRGFTAANTEINLNLTTANTPEEFEQARADIVIKYGHAPRPITTPPDPPGHRHARVQPGAARRHTPAAAGKQSRRPHPLAGPLSPPRLAELAGDHGRPASGPGP